MKTIKINEDCHQKLVELQTHNYQKNGVKLTLSDTIASLILMLEILGAFKSAAKKQYNFNDDEHK